MPKHKPAEIRRGQLFEAALELCAEKGYHATRVDDIAERAGLSKGSLYHHFKGKEELFHSLLEGMIHEIAEQITTAFADEQRNWADTLRQIFGGFLDRLREHPGIVVGLMEFYMLGLRKPHFRALFVSYYEELQRAMRPFIKRGIDRGDLPADLDSERFTWLLLTAGDGVMMVNVMLGKTQDGFDLSAELMELMITAATARCTAAGGTQ